MGRQAGDQPLPKAGDIARDGKATLHGQPAGKEHLPKAGEIARDKTPPQQPEHGRDNGQERSYGRE